MFRWVLYSVLYGVIRGREDYFVETFSLLEFSQSSKVYMYVCRLLEGVSYRAYCEIMVKSSAYESVVTEEFVVWGDRGGIN